MRNPTPFIQRMHAGGMMPIFFHPDEQVCLDILFSAYEGGCLLYTSDAADE